MCGIFKKLVVLIVTVLSVASAFMILYGGVKLHKQSTEQMKNDGTLDDFEFFAYCGDLVQVMNDTDYKKQIPFKYDSKFVELIKIGQCYARQSPYVFLYCSIGIVTLFAGLIVSINQCKKDPLFEQSKGIILSSVAFALLVVGIFVMASQTTPILANYVPCTRINSDGTNAEPRLNSTEVATIKQVYGIECSYKFEDDSVKNIGRAVGAFYAGSVIGLINIIFIMIAVGCCNKKYLSDDVQGIPHEKTPLVR